MWEFGWRTDAFELWCWRRLLRVPWTERRSNQSVLKELVLNIHWKYWSWSWNSNTLATWCEELMHWKRPWFWQRLKAGGEEDDRGWNGWITSPTQWTWVWANLGDSEGQRSLACCSPWAHNLATKQQQQMVALRTSQGTQWQRICLLMQELQEMRIQSLGREDPLEKEMATHSSILAWKLPWTEKPGRLQCLGS